MENIRLSLCMIVKNEEDSIGRCLKSVEGVFDEVIIVDTGSTDTTVEICHSYGCQIECFEWNGSFADARNYGIRKATGDWIMWLDADEEMDEEDKPLLVERVNFSEWDLMTIHLINYHGEQADKFNATDIAHTRLFRNTGLTFKNSIHECLDIGDLPLERIGHLDVRIHHYGYLDSIVEKKEKYDRNITMLEQQLEIADNVYWAQYYIAMELYRKRKFHEAFTRVNLSIKAFLEINLLPPSMVYKLKYSILIAMGSFNGAWPSIQNAISLYPDYVDLRFFKGMILYYLEQFESALQTFEECILMGEDNIHHLTLRGVGSFQAWHYKGLCNQKLGLKKEAVECFRRSLSISPQYKHAHDSLKQLEKEA